jgi:hypothetical protein
MFGLFKRGSRGGDAKPSIDAVRFDTTGYEFHGELQPGRLRVWWTPEGDGLGVHFFPLPPDLPSGAASVDELAAFYFGMLGDSGGKLVETRVVAAGGCPAVRGIVSLPQQPSGRSYIGSLTVPFRDFSFVPQVPVHRERDDDGRQRGDIARPQLGEGADAGRGRAVCPS